VRILGKALGLAVAGMMISAPVLAQAQGARSLAAGKLSVNTVRLRKGATFTKSSQLAGSLLLAFAGTVVFVGGTLIARQGSSKPASP
jgi:hypothetical protein